MKRKILVCALAVALIMMLTPAVLVSADSTLPWDWFETTGSEGGETTENTEETTSEETTVFDETDSQFEMPGESETNTDSISTSKTDTIVQGNGCSSAGCGSSISGTAVAVTSAALAALIIKTKRKD